MAEGSDIEVPIGAIGRIHSSDGFDVNIEMSDGFIFHMMLGDFVSYFRPIEGQEELEHEKGPMITESHPDFTLKGVEGSLKWEREHGHAGEIEAKGLRYIGYWYRVKGDGRADPADYIDEGWDEGERELVASYVSDGELMTLASWRGYSWCRFKCGKGVEGTRCLTDGKYAWPEGFAHYIREHSVRPPAEFIEHVKESREK
jgi:hypothetical protein